MAIPFEIVGEVVRDLRRLRLQGASGLDLLHRIEDEDLGTMGHWYLRKAFLRNVPNLLLILGGPLGKDPDALNARLESLLTQPGPDWTAEPPYPDVMTRFDREVFRAVARERAAHILVVAPNPCAGSYRDRKGYGPAPLDLVACSQLSGPNAGLMSVNPDDPRLSALLAGMNRTYGEHVEVLLGSGYQVADATDDFLVRNGEGTAFYPGYCLVGVYAADHLESIWRPRIGEPIRRELNARFGAELVRCGPLDPWEALGSTRPSGAAWPLVPALAFAPNGDVDVLDEVDAVRRKYKSKGIPRPYLDRGEDSP